MLPREGFDRCRRRRWGTGGHFDGGYGYLSEPCIRLADDGGIAHARVAPQHGSHLFRQDLEPAAIDGIVGTPMQVHESIGIDGRQVIGAEPVGSEAIAFDVQDAALPGRQFNTAVLRGDFEMYVGTRTTDAAALGGRELPMVGQCPTGDSADKLGRTIVDENGYAV